MALSSSYSVCSGHCELYGCPHSGSPMEISSSSNSFIKDRQQNVQVDINAKSFNKRHSPITKNLAINDFGMDYSPMMKSPRQNERGITNHYSPFDKFLGLDNLIPNTSGLASVSRQLNFQDKRGSFGDDKPVGIPPAYFEHHNGVPILSNYVPPSPLPKIHDSSLHQHDTPSFYEYAGNPGS